VSAPKLRRGPIGLRTLRWAIIFRRTSRGCNRQLPRSHAWSVASNAGVRRIYAQILAFEAIAAPALVGIDPESAQPSPRPASPAPLRPSWRRTRPWPTRSCCRAEKAWQFFYPQEVKLHITRLVGRPTHQYRGRAVPVVFAHPDPAPLSRVGTPREQIETDLSLFLGAETIRNSWPRVARSLGER
jgi:hypothetical protein